RMLLGYAVGMGEGCDGIEPYDEIGGLDAALIGPLVALLDALDVACQALTQAASAREWGERLNALLQVFFLAEDEHDEFLLMQLQDLRDSW
ncbi:exodeoxyribonuclease V subunit gamma, partial [Klebsiella pneumoniae]|nr:exodeoxyribonuclease V subunit gamma [Klebsiella pneumoniae]